MQANRKNLLLILLQNTINPLLRLAIKLVYISFYGHSVLHSSLYVVGDTLGFYFSVLVQRNV